MLRIIRLSRLVLLITRQRADPNDLSSDRAQREMNRTCATCRARSRYKLKKFIVDRRAEQVRVFRKDPASFY
jgi:uncharacterized protein GlcG (DUF336 family)